MCAHLRCFGHQPVHWSEARVKLQKAQRLAPEQDRLFPRLRITYAALEDVEQRMFLDAACHLLGRGVETAKRMWSGRAA